METSDNQGIKDRPGRKIFIGMTMVPYPLRAHGVSVRYLPLISHLSRSHPVDLLIVSGVEEELRHVDGLRSHCGRINVLPDPREEAHGLLAKCRTYLNFLLPSSPPIAAVAHGGSEVTRGIVESAGSEHYDVAIWVGAYLLPNFLTAIPSLSAGRILVDFIDSPYLWAIRSGNGAFSVGPLDRYDLWKTRRWEGEVIRKADATIYISSVDAEAVPSGMAPAGKRHVIPNGVNVPSGTATEAASLPSPNIGFLGNMLYPPNVEAVEWLYREVFLPLRETHPRLSLVVIGRDPVPSIRRLGREPGVIVTGTVEEIWPYIEAVDVFLFPLLRGAGLKNKILEAMYAGRPVLTTDIGNEGIDAEAGKDLVLCRTPSDFRREAEVLLSSGERRTRMGAEARKFVEKRFSWDRIAVDFQNLLFPEDRERAEVPLRSAHPHATGEGDS